MGGKGESWGVGEDCGHLFSGPFGLTFWQYVVFFFFFFKIPNLGHSSNNS